MVQYTLWGKEVDIDIPKDVFATEAERKETDATMPGCEHGWFESSTGAQLHYRKVLPASTSKIKGVVVFQHGITGQSGNAFILKNGRKINVALASERLNQAGYALYALDMLGHGYSEGKRWYVPDWKTNRDDLDRFARFVASQYNTDLPLFLFGESYGATLILHVARMWQDEQNAPTGFGGIALVAPFIEGDVPPYPIVVALRYGLAPFFPTWTPFFMPNPVSADKIWRDDEARACHTDPRILEMRLDGAGRPFCLGTAVSLLNVSEQVRSKVLPGLHVPFCVVHGVQDVPVPIRVTDLLEQLTTTPPEDRTVYRVEEAYHDLLSDPTADETMNNIIEFMDQRVQTLAGLPN